MGIDDLVRDVDRFVQGLKRSAKKTLYGGLLGAAMLGYSSSPAYSFDAAPSVESLEVKTYSVDAPHYVKEHRSSYRFPTPEFYVPTHGLRIHGASMHDFGPHLFGLTTPATGDIWIRDDLHGPQFYEVLLHEVIHNRYPLLTEKGVRDMVRGILGPDGAPLHHTRL